VRNWHLRAVNELKLVRTQTEMRDMLTSLLLLVFLPTPTFRYNIGWQLIFWTAAYSFLTTDVHSDASTDTQHQTAPARGGGPDVKCNGDAGGLGAADNDGDDGILGASDATDSTSCESLVRSSMRSPVLMGTFVGISVGLCRPLHYELYGDGGAMHFVGAGVDTLGQAMVPVVTLVIASTLGKVRFDWSVFCSHSRS